MPGTRIMAAMYGSGTPGRCSSLCNEWIVAHGNGRVSLRVLQPVQFLTYNGHLPRKLRDVSAVLLKEAEE